MPNENGRIFINTQTTPHQGVSIADVRQTLEHNTNDLGLLCSDQDWQENNGVNELVSVDKINKWAKYRPIEKANFKGVLTDTMRAAENWGIGNIPKWTNKTIPQMVRFWIGGPESTGSVEPDCGIQSSYWSKVLPSTMYRLLDFASTEHDGKGYWHRAEAPISQFEGELAIPSTGQLDVIYIRGPISGNAVEETILLSDIGNFGSFYFGVVFANADFSLIYIVTQEYPMNSESWTQDFAVHISGAGSVLIPSGTSATWKVFPILLNTQTPITTLTDFHSSLAEYTSVALLDYTEEVITKNGVNYTFLADEASVSGRTVSASFYFKNNETDTGLQGVRVTFEYKTNMGVVLYTQQVMVQCTGQNPGVVPADTYGYADGSHAFDSASVAASIYSVVAHVDQITGRDFTIQWAEAVVGALPIE